MTDPSNSENYTESDFKYDLIDLLESRTRALSKYHQLKTATIHVQYYDKTYIFSKIPLKAEGGQSLHDIRDYDAGKRLLEQNLEIVP